MTSVSRAFLCVEYGGNDVVGARCVGWSTGKTDIYAVIGISLILSGGH
ncbi:hypothetical protein VCR31J2_1310905 [Vibrio coralliirubri]|uniref:Uncharacterized protein n=1 Tax=Vibrio coralliirubri TaxID=1516159 RepID=A0AA86X253_9VIBR|nr:hypothetical protein [Vibrio coralliirubri]CDT80482.1 hypothetical protein VCR31J2_1310905 [Vibrio coralliirubri]